MVKNFRELGLKVYDLIKYFEKLLFGFLLKDNFSYLGYYFLNEVVFVRIGFVERLRELLFVIFIGYKYFRLKSLEFLEWWINLRVIGCIF